MNQAIGYGSVVEVQQIIPANYDSAIVTGLIFFIGFLCFLIVVSLWEIRRNKKLYNPKTTKTIRVKIHE